MGHLDTRLLFEDFSADMRDRAIALRRIVQFAGILFGPCNEFFERIGRY